MSRPAPLALRSLPALAAVLPFAASLHGEFVFDDHTLVESRRPDPGDSWLGGGLFGDLPAAAYYRPVLQLSWALDRWLYGSGAWGFHLTNLVLHLLLVLAAQHLIRSLTGRPALAAVAATLFAVHPVHVEPVAWISARGDLLAGLFVLAAWSTLVRGGWLPHAEPAPLPAIPDRRWLTLAALFWLAGVLSKESAVMLPAWVAWGYLLMAPLAPQTSHRQRGRELVAATLMTGMVAVALRFQALGSWRGPWPPDPLQNPAAGVDGLDRLATAGSGLLSGLRLLAWPWPLRADYGIPVSQPAAALSPPGLAGLAVLLLAFGWLLWASRRRPLTAAARAMTLGAGLLLLGWLPVSSLGPLPGSLVAERYLLLPSLGWCLLIAGALWAPGQARFPRWGLAALVGTVWLTLSILRVPAWADDETLFTRDVQHPRSSYKSAYFAGLLHFVNGDDDRAGVLFSDCTRKAPSYSPCHEGVGRIALRAGHDDAAIDAAREAIRQEPPYPPAQARYRVLLAEALWQQGDMDAAEALLGTATAMDPARATAPRRLGDLFMARAQADEAAAAYEMAVARDPDEPVARFNLAMARRELADDDAAWLILMELQSRGDPPSATWYHLGVLATMRGQAEDAAHFLQRYLAEGDDPAMLDDARRRLAGMPPQVSAPAPPPGGPARH